MFAIDRAEFAPGGGVPEAQRAVGRGGRERAAVRREGEGDELRTVAAKFADEPAGSDLANGDGVVKPVYVWSDMFDPHHNARENFYLVNNTLEGSWEGLHPIVIVMKWGGGERARPGLEFFASRGHQQMIAAYYDSDVATNHKMWTDAMEGIPNIVGVMYTTWRSDYSNLEAFAETWWGGK